MSLISTLSWGRRFRVPTTDELLAALSHKMPSILEPPFAGDLPAVPNEAIPPGDTRTVQPIVYGARTYGDLCNARQTLGFVELARAINGISKELLGHGSPSNTPPR